MGIEQFKKNLTNYYPNIFSTKKPSLDTLCIDLNYLLHEISRRAKSNVDFKNKLLKKIKSLLRFLNPSIVAIFTDGQALIPKVSLQIRRRLKHLYTSNSGFNTLKFTTGTPFMDFIDTIINDYLKSLSIETYYSSSNENNEGEIKMFQWLNDNKKGNKNTCIISDDSDIILLSLAYKTLLNIYIYSNRQFLSINELISQLAKMVPNKYNKLKNHKVRLDFVLLSLFQGNDYLKKICDFETLLDAYNKLQKNDNVFLINKNGNMNLNAIHKLFLIISKSNKISNTIYDEENVTQYFKSIRWNLDLYTNKDFNNVAYKCENINIATILHFFPKDIQICNTPLAWLDKDVYTLLLMPSVGKEILPSRLQPLLEEGSCVKDLFPDPCPECLEIKKQIQNLEKPIDDSNEEVKLEYSQKLNKLNGEYNMYYQIYHPIRELPIERLQKAVSSLTIT